MSYQYWKSHGQHSSVAGKTVATFLDRESLFRQFSLEQRNIRRGLRDAQSFVSRQQIPSITLETSPMLVRPCVILVFVTANSIDVSINAHCYSSIPCNYSTAPSNSNSNSRSSNNPQLASPLNQTVSNSKSWNLISRATRNAGNVRKEKKQKPLSLQDSNPSPLLPIQRLKATSSLAKTFALLSSRSAIWKAKEVDPTTSRF